MDQIGFVFLACALALFAPMAAVFYALWLRDGMRGAASVHFRAELLVSGGWIAFWATVAALNFRSGAWTVVGPTGTAGVDMMYRALMLAIFVNFVVVLPVMLIGRALYDGYRSAAADGTALRRHPARGRVVFSVLFLGVFYGILLSILHPVLFGFLRA